MGASYELWLLTDTGSRLALLDRITSLDYSMSVNNIGACSLVLPGDFDVTLLVPDRQIAVWRQPDGGVLGLERRYFLRKLTDDTDSAGKRTITVSGVDGNYLLDSRIIAYAAGSAQADQTDQADDIMKVVVRQNLGTSATTARQMNATYFSVAGDLAAGPSITKGFAWRNVLTVLQDIAEAARTAGTRVYFDMVPVSETQFEFRTFTAQLGLDRTYPSGINPVLLGLEFGNLAEPRLEQDWEDERTFVYGEGQGEGADRIEQTAEDTTRSGRSIWGRREALADARDQPNSAGVLARARAALDAGRPRLRFSGRIVDCPGTKYGSHWRWGDKLTAIYEGQSYAAQVKAVRVRLDENGRETIEARLETDEP